MHTQLEQKSSFVAIQLTPKAYISLQDWAQCTQRSIEAEITDAISAWVAQDKQVAGLNDAETLAQLRTLSDLVLWKVARRKMSSKLRIELERLHHKAQREGLTEREKKRAAALSEHAEMVMLTRARALRVLCERSHDVSELGNSQ